MAAGCVFAVARPGSRRNLRRFPLLCRPSFPLPVAASSCALCWPQQAEESILQYFNTSWKEIERRIPEVAEAGYTSLWLPPPAKGASGAYSVGYDPLDRFDLGDQNQAGSVPPATGRKPNCLRLVETAHRFGLRVYFDNVMAHNAGPSRQRPCGNAIPRRPWLCAGGLSLVRKPGGGWKKANDSIDYNDEWQVLNRNPFAWDIAQEDPNTSFDPTGQQEGNDYPKWVGVRHTGKDLAISRQQPAGSQPMLTVKCSIHLPTRNHFKTSATARVMSGAGNGRFDWQDTNGNGQHDVGEPSEPFTDTGVDPTNPAHQVDGLGIRQRALRPGRSSRRRRKWNAHSVDALDDRSNPLRRISAGCGEACPELFLRATSREQGSIKRRIPGPRAGAVSTLPMAIAISRTIGTRPIPRMRCAMT